MYLLIGHTFSESCCDLDLWPCVSCDPQISTKSDDSRPKRSWVIGRTIFSWSKLPQPWPSTSGPQNPIGVFYCYSTMFIPSLVTLGQSVLELMIRHAFPEIGCHDLDLSPCDPKINRALLQSSNNVPTKFDDWRPKSSGVIDRTRFS